jgi:hypothetical protein
LFLHSQKKNLAATETGYQRDAQLEMHLKAMEGKWP